MKTNYKLNFMGHYRIEAKYAEGNDVKDVFRPVLFVAVFFSLLAIVHFPSYVLLLFSVAF